VLWRIRKQNARLWSLNQLIKIDKSSSCEFLLLWLIRIPSILCRLEIPRWNNQLNIQLLERTFLCKQFTGKVAYFLCNLHNYKAFPVKNGPAWLLKITGPMQLLHTIIFSWSPSLEPVPFMKIWSAQKHERNVYSLNKLFSCSDSQYVSKPKVRTLYMLLLHQRNRFWASVKIAAWTFVLHLYYSVIKLWTYFEACIWTYTGIADAEVCFVQAYAREHSIAWSSKTAPALGWKLGGGLLVAMGLALPVGGTL